MTPPETTIGWIGAGKMGLPICHRLKDAGFKVHALGRSAAAQKTLRDAGFTVHDNVAELVAHADVIFTSVSDDAALEEVVGSALGHFRAGATFIDISTVSPQLSAKLAKLLEGTSYLRSPVSGSTALAQAGTLTAIVSGPNATFQTMAPVFAAFTRKAFHVGKAEEARFLKLVLNSMVAATSALLAEALAFGRDGGLDNATMLSVINQSVVASPLIGYKTDMIIKDDYKAAASLAMLKKDLDLLLAAAPKPLPLGTHIQQIYQNSIERGHGEEDFFVLVREANATGVKI